MTPYGSDTLVNIGSGNGLSPVSRQAIMWTNADILSADHQEQSLMKCESKYNTFQLGEYI